VAALPEFVAGRRDKIEAALAAALQNVLRCGDRMRDDKLKKLPKLISLLGSANDAEVLAAARAIDRLLSATGITWHDLAAAAEGVAVGRSQTVDARALDPSSGTEEIRPRWHAQEMMQHWRARRDLAEHWLNDPSFHRLPKAWQAAVRTFVKSTPHALGSIEKAAMQRVEARLGSWPSKDNDEWRLCSASSRNRNGAAST
jgi:hypothetical protein